MMKQVKLSIPTEWSDITIGTYQKYVDIQLAKGSEKKKIVDSLALLCGTTPTVVKKMNYKDLIEIMDILKKMIDTEPDKQQFRKTFVFKDDEYGFCPNLSAITTGEYIDLEAYCKDDPIKNLHVIMRFFFEFRVDISNKFSQLFGSTGTETTKGVSLQSKWGWYNTLYSLSTSILDIQKITKLPILEVLTYLSYTQDYNTKQNNKY
jgi:hypothetical protein